MSNISKHKVFISYYHDEDQYYKDELERINSKVGLFDDWSVRDGDIDDEGMSAEQIRRYIRDNFMKDATVLILLCGQNTKKRKHVDWEIHTAMFDTEKNPKMGILVVNLPTINSFVRARGEKEKSLVSNNTNWITLKTREEFEKNYSFMPSRIIDNFVKGVPIAVVEWNTIMNDLEGFKELIDIAFQRRKTNDYDHSAPLRRNNS